MQRDALRPKNIEGMHKRMMNKAFKDEIVNLLEVNMDDMIPKLREE